jgi:hypothetical protein
MQIIGRMPEAIRRKEVHIRRNPSLVPPYTGYTDYRGLHHFESHPTDIAMAIVQQVEAEGQFPHAH